MVRVSKSFGYFGVLVFFIISGYVIPFSLRGKRFAGVRRFAIRRFWRLYPPLWIALIVHYVVSFDSYSVSQLVSGATMFPSLLGEEYMAGHFWTLEIELIFYVVLALAFFTMGRIRGGGARLIFLVMTALLYLSPVTDSSWVQIVKFLTIMFFGAACREIMASSLGRIARMLALGTIICLVCLFHFEEMLFVFYTQGMVSYQAVVPSAIFCFLFWVILTPFRMEWLAKVGRSTYSTYLFHNLIVYYILAPIGRGGEVWMWPIYTAATIILSLLVGSFAYRWIEQPSDRIGKRIAG